jgi:hypothetical protein
MYGLIVYIYNKSFILENTFSINNLDEAKEELTTYLSQEFNKLHIDFPMNLIEFEALWCEHYSMEQIDNIFNYNIYDSQNNKWIKPWNNEEIYNDTLDKIIHLEINNNKDYNIDYYDDSD